MEENRQKSPDTADNKQSIPDITTDEPNDAIDDVKEDTAAGNDIEDTREDNLELHTMKFRERIKAKRAKLAKNMEGMSKSERAFYIISYYKWKIIAFIAILVCAIVIPVTIYEKSRPIAISYAIVNCTSPADINTDFVDDYMDYFGLTGNYQVRSDKELHLDKETYLEEYARSQGNSSYTEFPMMCFNGYYDIIITNKTGAVYCGMQEIMFPLKSYLPADIYSQIEDRVFETENHDGETEPFAIDISDTEFAKNLNLGYDDVYIGFPGTTEANYTNAKRMLNYILGVEIYDNGKQ